MKHYYANDMNDFLPFWPTFLGCGKYKKEVCAIIQPEEYREGVKATGKNPLGLEIKYDDNPIIVIGTLK